VDRKRIKLNESLTNENFKKFIETNPETGEKQLIHTKTNIAFFFHVSTATLYRWMKKNGYNTFIKKKEEKKEEKIPEDKIEEDWMDV